MSSDAVPLVFGGKGKGSGTGTDNVVASDTDNVKAKIQSQEGVVVSSPCPYSDFRLKQVEKEGPAWMKTSSFNKMANLGENTSFSLPASSADEYAGKVPDLFSGAATYHVVGCEAPFPLSLETLLPPAAVLPCGGVCGGICCPTPQGEFVEVKEKEKDQQEKGTNLWEEYLHKKKVKEEEKKDQLNTEDMHGYSIWETVVLEESAENQTVVEPRVVPPIWEWVPLLGDEKVVKENGKEEVKEKEKEKEKVSETVKEKARGRKIRSGLLSPNEAARARAGELERALVPLLFPGRLKRKFVSYKTCPGIRVISRANGDRVKQEERKKEMKRKELEKENLKQKEREMKETKAPCFGEVLKASELFIFGEKVKDVGKEKKVEQGGLFVFGCKEPKAKSYYKEKLVEEGSEVLSLQRPVVQVREEFSYPEPGKINFLHRLQGGLQVASVLGGQSLGDWARQLLGERVWEGMGGYFTTKGGKVLNAETPVNKLGLHGSQEVVLQGRLRGGGYSGGGKGVRGGGGNSVAAGDWTCGICHQSGCWNAKSTCYRCGAPRQQSQGLSGQANSGAWDMEGRYQSGVGTGMGGYRVIGPNGRDQSYVPGGNPTQRKGPQPGGKGRNKVGGDTGAGVGVGFGTGGGVVGGGGGGDNRSAFSWLGGGGGVGNPLPPGMVLSERDQAQFCLEHLKGLLKDERDVEEFSNFWEGRLPAKPEPAPVKTPTEAQRAEVFAQLTRRQDGLMKRVKEGQVRVDAAKAKVRQEEAVVEELERELKVVSDQVDAHRAENLRRAEEAKAPRVQEVGSDMDLEAACSSGGEFGVNLVTGKRRKVVRKNRFQGNKPTREELLQFFNGMSNPDRDWFKMQFEKDVGSGVGCTDHSLGKEEVEPDKVELNARASLAPTQEEVANTPCG